MTKLQAVSPTISADQQMMAQMENKLLALTAAAISAKPSFNKIIGIGESPNAPDMSPQVKAFSVPCDATDNLFKRLGLSTEVYDNSFWFNVLNAPLAGKPPAREVRTLVEGGKDRAVAILTALRECCDTVIVLGRYARWSVQGGLDALFPAKEKWKLPPLGEQNIPRGDIPDIRVICAHHPSQRNFNTDGVYQVRNGENLTIAQQLLASCDPVRAGRLAL